MPRTLFAALLLFVGPAAAAEAILPQNRAAFYFAEPIEVALSGVKKGDTIKLELRPDAKGPASLVLNVQANGPDPFLRLPGGLLAPGAYSLLVDGKAAAKLTVSSGVNRSRMLLSQTVADPKKAGGNFFLGNAFGFGLLDGKGLPLRDIRGRRSGGLEVFEKTIREDLPTVVYMYWTGYVTHKPFGSEKSWPADDLWEATRLLSFHTAQRLRRYARNIEMVGTLDEPGLSWGKTPAGGMASGFPNWDEEAWYAKRGWKYTQDPASRDAADWMKYMTVRCAIMKEVNERGKRDLKSIWPDLVFSTDLYAPQAIMDGTDPLNQQVNDVPSSHVFLDWGVGKLGALSGLYLEKADDPARKIAHAMNGQLFSQTVPQPHQRNAYRLMLNAMLAAGLHSNWWLNPTGMKDEDLAWVNEPGLRLGSLFRAFAPDQHDVAVLWSFTEAAMRQKDVAAREAKKKTGEQIKLMIASLPDVPGAKDKLVDINAYNVGGNYKEQVLTAHQALARAGYPAHVLHERVLADKLGRYKTLVVVGQTFDLPADVRKVLDEWTAKGGRIVVDGTTTVKFRDAVVTKADFRDPAFRWGAYFGVAEKKPHPFRNDREASVYHTNFFMDEMVRKAVAPMKAAMQKTKSAPAIVTDSVHLAAERHTAGRQQLILVINAHDQLPEIKETERHRLYNYAPLEATFTLQGVPANSVVWCIEGGEWRTARRVADPTKPIAGKFKPGEMKLFLVLPEGAAAEVKHLSALRRGNALEVMCAAQNEKDAGSVLPFTLTVLDPKGIELFRVHRATTPKGEYREVFPIGRNAPAGPYTVRLEGPIGGVKQTARATYDQLELPPRVEQSSVPVTVFDEAAIQKLLTSKAELTVAHGAGHKAQAEKLVKALAAKGVKATARPEGEVLRKATYPRVWSPFAMVHTPGGKEKKPAGPVKVNITLTTSKDGTVAAKTEDGKDVSGEWNLPSSVVTIAGVGYVDFTGDRELCFAPGVRLYFDERRQRTVLNAEPKEEKTTADFRKKWERPWSRLTTHHGAYQLPPQLPEAYRADGHLIVLGDSKTSDIVAAVQAAEVLPRIVDAKYPGAGRALLQYAWSPFAVEKDVIIVGASDGAGLDAGMEALAGMISAR